MTTNDDRPGRQPPTVRWRRWTPWILVPAILGALIGGAIAARATPVYRSETLVRVAPQRIPGSLVPSTASDRIDHLRMTSQQILSRTRLQILSRTRLERMIEEFDLYNEERRRGDDPEEIFEHMRQNVELNVAAIERGDAVVFRIAFTGTEPRTVMRVAEGLTALFVRENLRNGELLAEGAHAFLTHSLEEARRRLRERHTQLRAAREKRQPEAETLAIEYEVLQTTLKDLSAKNEEARIAIDFERHQIGEQLRVIDGARLPERPIAPDWREYVAVGAGGGGAIGGVVLLLGPARSLRRRRDTLHNEAPVSNESPSSERSCLRSSSAPTRADPPTASRRSSARRPAGSRTGRTPRRCRRA
jgi:uncharacterized protein involved in exopolysaccharide biosynthesis